jgi:glycosyltransferase involved in cell wall biosynthesis
MSVDRDFYASRTAACAVRGTGQAPAFPRVSCIMPTHSRRVFAGKALDYFARQDYPNAELVIVDDGDDSIADLAAHATNVRYIRLPSRTRLGAKRNMAIEAGTGDIILHWDDDDWMHAGRISTQVAALLSGGDICGASAIRFCEIPSGRLSLYRYLQPQRHWLYGATLCYRRSFWRQKPFAPIDIGEDTRFVWEKPLGRVIDLAGSPLLIAMVHGGNISNPRPGSGANWQALPELASDALGNDWPFYANLVCSKKKELLF